MCLVARAEVAKALLLRLMHGGSYKAWAEEFGVADLADRRHRPKAIRPLVKCVGMHLPLSIPNLNAPSFTLLLHPSPNPPRQHAHPEQHDDADGHARRDALTAPPPRWMDGWTPPAVQTRRRAAGKRPSDRVGRVDGDACERKMAEAYVSGHAEAVAL